MQEILEYYYLSNEFDYREIKVITLVRVMTSVMMTLIFL